MDADDIIRRLDLKPHPEGGHYREMFRDAPTDGSRGAMTSIYFLLKAGESSHWHKVDAAEIWHYYAGAPLDLSISDDGKTIRTAPLGPDLLKGEQPQITVPPDAWQAASSQGAWTLVGCTVGPAFDFKSFVLAPKDWKPG